MSRKLPYLADVGGQRELFVVLGVDLGAESLPGDLKTKNGRKNVKSARDRPILSANRRRQRPAHAYARADPAQNGQTGGN